MVVLYYNLQTAQQFSITLRRIVEETKLIDFLVFKNWKLVRFETPYIAYKISIQNELKCLVYKTDVRCN